MKESSTRYVTASMWYTIKRVGSQEVKFIVTGYRTTAPGGYWSKFGNSITVEVTEYLGTT